MNERRSHRADEVKLLSAYPTAVAIALGGTLTVVAMLWAGIISAEVGVPILSAVIFGATGFLWGQESATRAVREYERGLNTPTPPEPEKPEEPKP